MRYYLIAIGGSIMHNLAIDLQDLGHEVAGSDDEIYEPSRSKLEKYKLLPSSMGWDAARINNDIDVVILGKHAKDDNPELARAKELGLSIMSFPEFISSSSKATKTIAITGSHGKTTTTSMAMYVMKKQGLDFDYLVGAQIDGFKKMVRMSGAEIMIVEGDEYPSSCLDNDAKMLHYKADVSVITGIAWDHVNIYKTYDSYKEIFDRYLSLRDAEDLIFFDQSDSELLDLVVDNNYACKRQGYMPLVSNKKGEVLYNGNAYPIKVFGEHNLKNMNAARLVCNELGITTELFLQHIRDFTGAAKRLELIETSSGRILYKDFAHAPSKAKATAEAVRSKHKNVHLASILELHTFSSLTMAFIEHYKDTLHSLDEVYVFYDPHALEMKKMPALVETEVAAAFNHPNLQVVSSVEVLEGIMNKIGENQEQIVLIMSSGNLGGLNLLDHF